MHLRFDKGGLRFFFFTAAIRGRRPVLSRIVPVTGRRAAACAGWGAEPSRAGEALIALWRGVHGRDPFLTASNFAIMPDHVHFLLLVDYRRAPDGFDLLGWWLRFRRAAAAAIAPILGGGPEAVWEEKYWIMLLNAGTSLPSVRHYIRMNPARKKTVPQHEPEIASILERAKSGAIPVSGFLSPGEKRVLALLRAEPDTRWIRAVPHGLPPRFDPTVEESRFLAAGRQLVLSSFPTEVPEFPVSWDNCHIMNDRILAMCARAGAK